MILHRRYYSAISKEFRYDSEGFAATTAPEVLTGCWDEPLTVDEALVIAAQNRRAKAAVDAWEAACRAAAAAL